MHSTLVFVPLFPSLPNTSMSLHHRQHDGVPGGNNQAGQLHAVRVLHPQAAVGRLPALIIRVGVVQVAAAAVDIPAARVAAGDIKISVGRAVPAVSDLRRNVGVHAVRKAAPWVALRIVAGDEVVTALPLADDVISFVHCVYRLFAPLKLDFFEHDDHRPFFHCSFFRRPSARSPARRRRPRQSAHAG